MLKSYIYHCVYIYVSPARSYEQQERKKEEEEEE